MQDEGNNLVRQQTKMPKDEWICRKMPQDNQGRVLPSARLLATDEPIQGVDRGFGPDIN
jgi:hypothetical protein